MSDRMQRALAGLMLMWLLSGCADNRLLKATETAGTAHMTGSWLQTEAIRLMSWHRIREPGAELSLYIEGDGFAYITREQVSPDPTPRSPLVLQLAARTPGNVAYLARPCMYFDPGRSKPDVCQAPLWWTTGRFSDPVVTAMNQAVEQLKRLAGASRLHLIGFSGGGAIAALIAARRDDVATLRTLAGNLDHAAFTRFHRVTPLTESLNPVQIAPRLARLPQIHFVGAEDPIVPQQVARNFVNALGDAHCAQIVSLPGVKHDESWLEIWPDRLKLRPQCNTTP